MKLWHLVMGLISLTMPLGAQVAMEGIDLATLVLPKGVEVEAYENNGYHLDIVGGRAQVRVDLSVLDTKTTFNLPAQFHPEDPVGVLAKALVVGESTRFGAVSKVLEWVATNIQYKLDREQSQKPEAVLERRNAYCTGVARLTVALLTRLKIPAREVPGVIVDAASGERGFHRWVEIHYPDRGWVFSDPLHSHHYVPATYVRIADEMVVGQQVHQVAVIERKDGRQPVDYLAELPPGVSIRRNNPRQRSGALKVVVAGADHGVAVLEKNGITKTRSLDKGRGIFLGVEPGTYTLSVYVEGREPMKKKVVFRDRVRGAVYFPA